MNLCDSAFPHANDAVRKIGLFTRLPINRLNLLHDSEQGHAAGRWGPVWGLCVEK